MLHVRSIAFHFCALLLLCTSVKSQYYESEYNVDDHDSDDHGSYSEGDAPDYSKYYNQDTSAPIISSAQPATEGESSGFVTPLDFSGFFASSNFGFGAAPSSQILQPVQNQNGFVDPSHFQAAAQQAGFQQFTLHPSASFNNFFSEQPKKAYKESSEADDLNNEGYNTEENDDEEKPKPKKPQLTYRTSKYAPGKSSYNSPVKNYSPQYYTNNKYTNIKPTLTPYQKYSFQPVSNLKSASFENIKSTSLPFYGAATKPVPYALPSSTPYKHIPTTVPSYSEYTQASDIKSQRSQGKNCKKVEKQLSPHDLSHGRFRRDAQEMNCFICQDPKTGGSYEQCSYTSDPNDSEYFTGHASKYSTVTYEPEDRIKRSTRDRRNKKKRQDKNEEDEPYINPYNEEKTKSHSFDSKPEEFDSDSYYQPPDFSSYKEDYRFGPEYFTDSTNEEKSYSEQQAEELKKNGENCKKVKKDSMTCMVCTNPKTGGNYEQCSYSSEPQEKKYSYVKEKKYNSNDDDDGESTQQQPRKTRKQKQKQTHDYEPYQTNKRQRKTKKPTEEGYDVFHPSTSNKNENKYRGLNPELYGEADEKPDYVYKLFPEYAEKESAVQEKKIKPGFEYKSELPEYFTAEESKKDVESVLEEFSKKDRSKCKKITKDKMTCYLCTDEKGVQHEECMFVSESQPKSSHLAYHEVKEFTSEPKSSENKQEITKVRPTTLPRVRGHKKEEIQQSPVETTITETHIDPNKKVRIARRKTNINKQYLETQTHAPIQKREVDNKEVKNERTDEGFEGEIKEVKIENGDGAYASELVPVYSKKLGTTLPAYMLQISESEREFDEVVAGGI